jgi:hypothetical protein
MRAVVAEDIKIDCSAHQLMVDRLRGNKSAMSKFKIMKDAKGNELLELGPVTGLWTDSLLDTFLGQTAKGWPAKFDKVKAAYLHWTNVNRFAGFAHLPNLEWVWCVSSGCLQSFEGLESCTKLTKLMVPGGPKTAIKSLEPLRALTNLQTIKLEEHSQLVNIDAIEALENLTNLNLGASTSGPISIGPIGKAHKLEFLSLRKWHMKDLNELRDLHSLRLLNLSFAPALCDISALAELPALERIRLYGVEVTSLIGYEKLAGKICGHDGVENWDDNNPFPEAG